MTLLIVAVDRLPRRATTRVMLLGGIVGCAMRGLRWSQERLRSHALEQRILSESRLDGPEAEDP